MQKREKTPNHREVQPGRHQFQTCQEKNGHRGEPHIRTEAKPLLLPGQLPGACRECDMGKSRT